MAIQINFGDSLGADFAIDAFVIHVPKGIRTKEELFDKLTQAGEFPPYFGRNWDALLDCLRDFEWIPARKIAIIHEDLPLIGHQSECRTYLDILNEAVMDWSISNPLEGNGTRVLNHEIKVLFPSSVEGFVRHLLS